MDGGTYFAEVLGLPSKKVAERDYNDPTFGDRARLARLCELELSGKRKPKLDVTHSMYVYSDIVEPQSVGDSEAPLLGIVPVGEGSPGHRVHFSFDPPVPVPVAKPFIKTINIKLATERGERVPFAAASDTFACGLRFFREAPYHNYQQPFVL